MRCVAFRERDAGTSISAGPGWRASAAGPRGDDQAQLPELATRQQPGKCRQHRPVRPRQPRGLDLTLKHGDLMAQNQDLGVPRAIGSGEQGKLAEHPQRREVSQS
jgi:hypothetical protein